jgi:hypothetical protein
VHHMPADPPHSSVEQHVDESTSALRSTRFCFLIHLALHIRAIDADLEWFEMAATLYNEGGQVTGRQMHRTTVRQ